MALDGVHWFIAFLTALFVHAAGLLWLDTGRRTMPLDSDSYSDEIVVMLGQESGEAADITPYLNEARAARQVDSPETVSSEVLDEVAERVMDSTPVIEQVPSADEPHRPEEVETVNTLGAKGIDSVNTEPEIVRTQTSSIVESVVLSSVVAQLEPHDPEADSPPPAKAVSPKAEIIEIVSPETLLVKESESGSPVAPVTAEAGSAPTIDQINAVNAAKPDTTEAVPSVVASVTAPEVDSTRPATAVDTGQEVSSAVLDLATVETLSVVDQTTAAFVEPVDTPQAPATIDEQIARVVTLEELAQQSGGEGVVAGYAGLLKGRLQENMHYPRVARMSGQEGRAVVRFVIDRRGKVLSIELEQPSGYPILDREAIEMIERSDPFPGMPTKMLGANLELRVPIAFEIKDDQTTRNVPPINLE